MKLGKPDYKLLSYLYHNHREPITKIAKACNLSREQVNYRLNKYLSEKLIRKFIPIFNYAKLGYNYFVILFLKLDKLSNEAVFFNKLSKDRNCISFGKVFGKYDVYTNFIFKDEQDFSNYLSKLLESQIPVSDYLVIKPYFAELYPLKFFNHTGLDRLLIIGKSSEKISLDKKDILILKELSHDSRARLVDIAEKLNTSSEFVLHRLKRLKKEEVILGSRIQFDMEKVGFHFSEVLLNIRNFSEENKNKVKKFAKTSKHVNSLLFSLTKPNCIIQLFHKEESELRNTIQKVKKLFEDEIIDLDFMLITDETAHINPLPFL